MLQKIKEIGIDTYVKKHSLLSAKLKSKLQALNLKIVPVNNSNFVLGVWTPDNIDASRVVEIMKGIYNISIAPSPGELKTKMFRIGTIGNITEEDVNFTIECLQKTLTELGYSA